MRFRCAKLSRSLTGDKTVGDSEKRATGNGYEKTVYSACGVSTGATGNGYEKTVTWLALLWLASLCDSEKSDKAHHGSCQSRMIGCWRLIVEGKMEIKKTRGKR